MGEADVIRTGRIETMINPVMAEVTLGCDLLFIVKANGMVRAFLNTKLTSGAFLGVEDDDPVSPFHDGFHRAYLCAGRVIAMFADIHTPYEVKLPFISFGPSPQTDRYLIPFSASTGLNSCLQANSQAIHPQQANSSIISHTYSWLPSFLLLG